MNLPDRLSVDDMATSPELCDIGRRIEVLFNGTVRDHVISYDVPGRTITRFATDEHGHIIIEGDDAKRETLTGDVAVRLKSDDAPHERCGSDHHLLG